MEDKRIITYLTELLFEHSCVIIPDFGGFLTIQHNASIHPLKHNYTPPSRKIAFNERIKSNDGVLVSKIVAEEKISDNEALYLIKNFVTELNTSIQEGKVYTIDQIGSFSLNEESKLQFQPANELNFQEESFGLPELHFKPIEREDAMKRVPQVPPRQALRRPPVRKQATTESTNTDNVADLEVGSDEKIAKPSNKKAVFIIIPVVLILAAAVSFFFVDQQNKKQTAALIETTEEKQTSTEETVTTEVVAEVEEVKEAAYKVPAGINVVYKSNNANATSYVIAGAFTNKKYAERLASKSSNATIIEMDGFYRVSVANHSNIKDAVESLPSLKARFGNDIWILVK